MRAEIRMMTTHVDKHTERVVPEALDGFVNLVNQQYLPIGVEHDPRVVPVGRLLSAHIVELEDGEFAVDGIAEIFEDEDEIEFRDDGREIPLKELDEAIQINPDRSYRYPEDQKLVEELSSLVDGEIQHQTKKAEEPISHLIIAASFVAGGIATGFLSKIGEDLWDVFKEKLNNLVNGKNRICDDRLLSFEFIIEDEKNPLCLETILTNPNESDISRFMQEGLKKLDKQTNHFFQHRHYVRKVIFEYKDNKLYVIYALRKDGVPLSISNE